MTGLGGSIRRHPIAAAVAVGAVTGFGVYGAVTGANLTVTYIVVVTLGIVVIGLADDSVRFSRLVIVALTVWAVSHLAGGIIGLDGDRILYNAVVGRWLHLDNAVHFVGFGAAGLAWWEALRPRLRQPIPRWTPMVATLVAGMGSGAFNEVVEFGASHAFATNVGGYQNTGRDLVANMLGGMLAGFIAMRRQRRGTARVLHGQSAE